MSDVGLGQDIVTTGRYRSKVLKDAVRDNHPLYKLMEEKGGVKRIDGGRTVIEEGKTAQNTSVSWVGERGSVSLNDQRVIDGPEYPWKYILGSVSFSLGERYRNMGESQYIDLIAGKFEVLEDSMMNIFHAGMLSSGTGTGGLQLTGLAALLSTTPTSDCFNGMPSAALTIKDSPLIKIWLPL